MSQLNTTTQVRFEQKKIVTFSCECYFHEEELSAVLIRSFPWGKWSEYQGEDSTRVRGELLDFVCVELTQTELGGCVFKLEDVVTAIEVSVVQYAPSVRGIDLIELAEGIIAAIPDCPVIERKIF